jgi:hypothetical protein
LVRRINENATSRQLLNGLLAIAREPLWVGSKQLKSQVAAQLCLFLSHCLQKQAFDAVKQKSQPDG